MTVTAETEQQISLSPEGLAHVLAYPEALGELARVAKSFREFLNYWMFLDQDTGKVRNLGESLWPAQEEFVKQAQTGDWIFFLKARQLGETTIACAYDAWVGRFRGDPTNARVHMFSKREKEAQALLTRVKFGLLRLPAWMQLPIGRDTVNDFELIGPGDDDVRRFFAYPANDDTARGETCNHAHLDEWAFMGNPSRVWQSVEPSAAGTVHFVTTGMGPANWTSQYWLRCMAGDALDRRSRPIRPCFIGALNRPDRNPAWLKAKRAGMDEDTFMKEYPMKWEDALSGGGEYVFKSPELHEAGIDARGLMTYQEGRKLRKTSRKYVRAWDIGRHQDAAVGIVLDVTEDVMDVVAYVRLRGVTYPQIQQAIMEMHDEYPGGLTAIEKNSAGEAVLENLDLPQHTLEGFSTNGQSKPRIISQLRLTLQNQLVKWDPKTCDQLDAEMRGYQLPDDNVVQDSVIALAIAVEYAAKAHMMQGKIGGIIQV